MKYFSLKNKEFNFRTKLSLLNKILLLETQIESSKINRKLKRRRNKYLILSKSISRRTNRLRRDMPHYLMRRKKLKEKRPRSLNNYILSTKSTKKDVNKNTMKKKLLIKLDLKNYKIKEIKILEGSKKDLTSLLFIMVKSLKKWKRIKEWSLISKMK
jgi:hypothetical protein